MRKIYPYRWFIRFDLVNVPPPVDCPSFSKIRLSLIYDYTLVFNLDLLLDIL